MEKLQRYTRFFINAPTSLISPKENIFILSHMRSTSSLLSHVLSAHEQICGHKELHSSYTKASHLIKTKASLFEERQSYEQADYLLDKLLHNRLVIDEKIFKKLPKYIFLLRNPERTMSSMIKMHLEYNDESSIYKLEEYYLNRLEALIDYWLELKGEKIFISSEQLTDNTSETLDSLSHFLGLDTPLSEHYSVYTDTGKGGIGDPSHNIKAGKILKSTPVNKRGRELMEQLDMGKITKAYIDAVNTFTMMK